MDKNSITMDKLVALCKGRGFVFAGSDIYGGLANSWDYGPLGVELKDNIKREWWKFFVQEADNSVGLDAGILMHPRVWEASGHVSGFSDPLMDCKGCKTRHRADNLIDVSSNGKDNADSWTHEQMQKYIDDKKINCPNCGKREWTPIRNFNLMFKTHRGVTDDSNSVIYLRPETAQGQYVNFLNVQRSMRLKLPFGIGQVGKAFRNEITPGNFIFRTLEFEQLEHQLFCRAEDSDKYYLEYKKKIWDFYVGRLGIDKNNLRYHDHDKLVFYAKAAVDMEYKFCFGWKEINGTHHRGTHDLTQHARFSEKDQSYTDPVTNEKYVPTIIESSMGLTRAFLVVLHDAYTEEVLDDGETRVVLRLKPSLAPYKVAVLPLQKKDLTDKAREVYRGLCKNFMATYDDTASIGKRYRRQDEIGTPFCVTVDYDTLTDGCVTVRDRDSMGQERVAIAELGAYLWSRLGN
jgi:glycyl-tRNA synthetase